MRVYCDVMQFIENEEEMQKYFDTSKTKEEVITAKTGKGMSFFEILKLLLSQK